MMFWRWISKAQEMAARSDEDSATCGVGIPWYQLVLALMKWPVESCKQQPPPKEHASWKMAASTLHFTYSSVGVPCCNLRVDAGLGLLYLHLPWMVFQWRRFWKVNCTKILDGFTTSSHTYSIHFFFAKDSKGYLRIFPHELVSKSSKCRILNSSCQSIEVAPCGACRF